MTVKINLESLVKDLKEMLKPEKIFLFKRDKNEKPNEANIKICVVADLEKNNISKYFDLPEIDFIFFTPLEWEAKKENSCSFVKQILKDGIMLYG
ncbi:hypothetical protein [Natranaerofaba carboxydovora]|uniref:hypothetical protein n=1 Tax=Natranaerofaba carboxydovora TaxID=2742683 RepID=UPI001F140B57|nr:hypothetical protein [Natranaerofaba carboxydovora]UMZ74864.1 hypothetical protein ACONDI_02468 [Natranaerofaba carboxydovora]